MDNTSPLNVVNRYFDALAEGNFQKVMDTLDPNVVWHQPGKNIFSGVHKGSGAVAEMIGKMLEISQGTFHISLSGAPMVNSNQVALPINFSAHRGSSSMYMTGIDVMTVTNGLISEVRLFTGNQEAEDNFWK